MQWSGYGPALEPFKDRSFNKKRTIITVTDRRLGLVGNRSIPLIAKTDHTYHAARYALDASHTNALNPYGTDYYPLLFLLNSFDLLATSG